VTAAGGGAAWELGGIVSVGDVMTDVVVRTSGATAYGSDTPSHITTEGGGSAANVAAWVAATRSPAAFVGRRGDDPYGLLAEQLLRAVGVQPHLGVDGSLPTGTCVVLVAPDGERSMFPDAGANAALSPDDLPPGLFARGRHLHLSGYPLLHPGARAAAFEALGRARGAGMSVSIDPSSGGLLRAVGPDAFLGWIAGADVLLANEEESRVLTGCDDPDQAARSLLDVCEAVVVKLGAQGALVRARDGSQARVAALPVEVVDTTGAGDSFAAGLLPAWRAGAGWPAALEAGARLAARCVAQVGARP
jgi:sugar/nucleoside kinase (ribokinase family)